MIRLTPGLVTYSGEGDRDTDGVRCAYLLWAPKPAPSAGSSAGAGDGEREMEGVRWPYRLPMGDGERDMLGKGDMDGSSIGPADREREGDMDGSSIGPADRERERAIVLQ